MKEKIIFLISVFALVLSACSGESESLADEITVDGVYTQVALTLSAQPAVVTSTSAPTMTLAPTTTFIPVAPSTATSALVSYSLGNSGTCDNSAYLSDVTIPDGTEITPGSTFTKTWSLQNTGSCEWTTSYSIVFHSGNSMSGATTSLSEAVSSGGNASISVELIAPTTAGSYTGYWRLQNASGVSFGEAVYVQIVVSGSTATTTYTQTATSEEEATSTPAPTTEPTSTTEPTAAPEPTETPTS